MEFSAPPEPSSLPRLSLLRRLKRVLENRHRRGVRAEGRYLGQSGSSQGRTHSRKYRTPGALGLIQVLERDAGTTLNVSPRVSRILKTALPNDCTNPRTANFDILYAQMFGSPVRSRTQQVANGRCITRPTSFPCHRTSTYTQLFSFVSFPIEF